MRQKERSESGPPPETILATAKISRTYRFYDSRVVRDRAKANEKDLQRTTLPASRLRMANIESPCTKYILIFGSLLNMNLHNRVKMIPIAIKMEKMTNVM